MDKFISFLERFSYLMLTTLCVWQLMIMLDPDSESLEGFVRTYIACWPFVTFLHKILDDK